MNDRRGVLNSVHMKAIKVRNLHIKAVLLKRESAGAISCQRLKYLRNSKP